ncbi:MAG: hypothetical protein WKF52_03705 [Sphingomicrobium sp.]
MTVHAGSCHCGSVSFRYESATPLNVRECQCSFCRKHGSRNVSDPKGSIEIVSRAALTRYRFGLCVTDFLICPACGTFVAAGMGEGSECYSTLNLNCFDDPHPELVPEPMVYHAEDAGDRLERRRQRWTPTRIVEPEPAGSADA